MQNLFSYKSQVIRKGQNPSAIMTVYTALKWFCVMNSPYDTTAHISATAVFPRRHS